MSLERRIYRLERKKPSLFVKACEIPTPMLIAMVRKAYWEQNRTPEEAELYSELASSGFDFGKLAL